MHRNFLQIGIRVAWEVHVQRHGVFKFESTFYLSSVRGGYLVKAVPVRIGL